MNKPDTFDTVDQYIASFPESGRGILMAVRQIVREVAPDAQESISYKMPTYKLNGPLVYFALYEKHLGFYPTPDGVTAFESELKPFRQGKGSVQFPLNHPIPFDLIRRMIVQRVAENSKKKTKRLKS